MKGGYTFYFVVVFLFNVKRKDWSRVILLFNQTSMLPDVIKEAARILRKNMTESEEKLWDCLKNKKLWVRFLRQKPIHVYTEDNWLARYVIPDFYCSSQQLIIEVDWNIHDIEEVLLLDKHKERLLKQKWIKIIRITNEEILSHLDNTILKIKQKLQ